MMFSKDDRVHIAGRPKLQGRVTGERIGVQFGVLWDTGDFGFVHEERLAHVPASLADPLIRAHAEMKAWRDMPKRVEAIPGLPEADRAALSKAYNLAIGAVEAAPDWQARAEAAEQKVAAGLATLDAFDSDSYAGFLIADVRRALTGGAS